MAAKAGKFVLRAGDMSVYPGNNGFSVTGVGFNPAIVIVMSVGLTSENAWDTTPNTWGCMSMWGNLTGGSHENVGLNEFWGTDLKPSSGWSNSGVSWLKASHGGGGPAYYIAGTHADGFYIGYPGGGYEGGYGVVVYYLALEIDKKVGHSYGYQGLAMPVTLGWEPSLILSLGHGGLGPGADDIFMADFSVPTWAFGGFDNVANPGSGPLPWLANGLSASTSVEQVRYILDGDSDPWIFDPQTVAQSVSNSYFWYGRTPTEVSLNYVDGFPQAPYIRTSAFFVEEALSSAGGATPNPVGTPLTVEVGFEPECVIFMSPQDHHDNGTLGLVPWGGRSFGFLTKEFQCCIAWGAYSHIGSTASFCSSDIGWISNFTSTQLSDPTNPNYGTAEIDGSTFIMHTQARPKFNQYTRWVAFGFDEEAPGFFRRLGG